MVDRDAVVETLERKNRLLENLDYGYPAHVFYRFGVHLFEGLHVAFHELGSPAAKGA